MAVKVTVVVPTGRSPPASAKCAALRSPNSSPPYRVPHPTEQLLRITPYWTNPHRDLSLRVEVPKPPKPATPATPSRRPGLLSRVVRIVRKH
ncbi:hypothetical protein ACFRCI_17760 [Streptomyces sp. NPDC056638]|uniref:hypothetical protein n=1 Tax=Streptomyces sp. NPDC056638 TaxID=3345887 RepID=UPI0036A9E5E6